jgi:WD40 repeat protein
MALKPLRCLIFLFIAGLAVPTPAQQPNLHLTQTVLGVLPSSLYGALQASPGNHHVFSTVLLGKAQADSGAWALYRDGVLVGRYDGKLPRVVTAPPSSEPGVPFQFSTDGEHYALVGERGGKKFIVYDGVEGPQYNEVKRFRLNPTGSSVAYVVGTQGIERLVLNGQIGPTYDEVYPLEFSPDGRHFAYVATTTGSGQQLFLDGEPQINAIANGRGVQAITFSANSRHLAFVTTTDKGFQVILDKKTVGVYTGGIDRLYFSPDGNHLAFEVYHLRDSDADSVVADGVERHSPGASTALDYLFVERTEIAWSPDSKHMAYVVRRSSPKDYPMAAADVRGDGVWPCPTACYHMVLDGVESPGYFSIERAQFLDDGRLAYSAFEGTDWMTLIGNERIPGVRLVTVTADGVHRIFAVGSPQNPSKFLLIDGKQYSATASYCCFPYFSVPAGKHFVYGTAYPPNEAFVAVDGIRQPGAGKVTFSPAEDHMACVDRNEVLVDGTPILNSGSSEPKFSFDSNYHFHAFAIRGNQLVRVDGYF